ncbi:MAG: hypothetical protein ACRDIF_03550 [Actinomycetota bacterium]
MPTEPGRAVSRGVAGTGQPEKWPPQWERVLAAAARLQELVPDAVLVGGAAAAHHARHRLSFDGHVLADLRERFDDVLGALEESEGWVTARVNRPVLILGSLDGVETGIRQLVRRRPLEVEQVEVAGRRIRVPTLPEITRIKAWLILKRNATRDYLDFVALADRLGAESAVVGLSLDDYYSDQAGPHGRRVAAQLAKQLAEPAPYDLSEVDLRHYRRLASRWQDWAAVVEACRRISLLMLDRTSRE